MIQPVLHTHTLAGHSAGGKQHGCELALPCVPVCKTLVMTQATNNAVVFIYSQKNIPADWKKTASFTLIRGVDWFQSSCRQEAAELLANQEEQLLTPSAGRLPPKLINTFFKEDILVELQGQAESQTRDVSVV